MAEKSDNPLSRVLSRWGLGTDEPGRIEPEEEHQIVHCLGAAVIARWADLPRDIQRTIFEAAVNAGSPQREDIAVFLHAHHRDTAARHT